MIPYNTGEAKLDACKALAKALRECGEYELVRVRKTRTEDGEQYGRVYVKTATEPTPLRLLGESADTARNAYLDELATVYGEENVFSARNDPERRESTPTLKQLRDKMLDASNAWMEANREVHRFITDRFSYHKASP